MEHQNISLLGFFLSSNGLGRAVRNIAHSLGTTSHSFSCVNLNFNGTRGDDEFKNKCSKYLPNKINFLVTGVDLSESLANQISSLGRGSKNFLYPYWELDRIPAHVVKAIGRYDKVIAPSNFIADTFQKYVDYKIPVINQPVLVPQNISANKINDGKLTVFSMMDLDSYIARKNPSGAISAFQMAFPKHIDNVELILKIKGNRHRNRDLKFRNNLLSIAQQDSRIKVIDGDLDSNQISKLIDRCNIFLSLHRSEGFGFGPAEAMASGKIVVATHYGGVTDFLNKSTGYPVSYKLIAVQKGEYIYGENQIWADPSLHHAAKYLQEIYKNFNQALERAKIGRQVMIDNFSFISAGKQLQYFFDHI